MGQDKPKKIDVRLIAATNKDLMEEARAGRFRKDLYFRLKESMLYIPPLSERKNDIMPLVWHFISIFNSLFDKKISRITKEAEFYLKDYAWEGNVRELKNTIKSIFSLKNNNAITMNDLVISLHGSEKKMVKKYVSLEEHELEYIKEILDLTSFNIKKAAEILGITRGRLYRKLKLMNIDMDQPEEEKMVDA